MAATFVTVAELRSALGIGSLYSDSVVEEVCQSSEDIVNSYLWKNEKYNYAHSSIVGSGTLYFNETVTDSYYIGQSVTISNNGSRFNGTKTITNVGTNSITVTTSHNTIQPIHPTNPYGTVATETYVTYATTPAVREASLMIAVDIWQARSASNAGGISPDFQPSPYRMGNTLTARVRGLLAPYLSPNSLVG
jgi:hypothetical protein